MATFVWKGRTLGGEMQSTCFGAQLNAAEHEHGRARRDATRNDGEPRSELVLGDRNPQAGTHHDF